MATQFDEAGDDDQGDELPPVSLEDRARAMGWKPQNEYRGDPRRWTDAETFIAHGERELPILRDQNRRMSEKLARTDGEVSALRNTIAEQGKAVRDAMALARRADQKGYERGLAELKAKQREAVATGDTEAFDQVQQQIDAAERERQVAAIEPATAPDPTPAPAAVPVPQTDPATTAFFAENPWFHTDPELGRAMIAEHIAVKTSRPHLPLADQYAVARARLVEAFPDRFPDEDTMSQQPAPPPAPRPRPRAAVLTPSSAQPIARRGASAFDQIDNPSDRAEAKEQFQRVKNWDPDTTEQEFVSLYLNPKQDVLALRAQRKKA